MNSGIYSKEFYQKHEKGAILSAENILSFLYDYLKFDSIIDFGCGIGCWIAVAKRLFNTKILGIDFHNCTELIIEKNDYISADLTKPLSVACSFDLVLSLEVAEHIAEVNSSVFLDNICSAGNQILFSAAFPGQGGTGHVNEKSLSYWVKQFLNRGYLALDVIRPHFWDCEDIDIWYRNNCILFIKESIFHEISTLFIKAPTIIDIIHPKMLKRIMLKGVK